LENENKQLAEINAQLSNKSKEFDLIMNSKTENITNLEKRLKSNLQELNDKNDKLSNLELKLKLQTEELNTISKELNQEISANNIVKSKNESKIKNLETELSKKKDEFLVEQSKMES